jgi:hypothetical protein
MSFTLLEDICQENFRRYRVTFANGLPPWHNSFCPELRADWIHLKGTAHRWREGRHGSIPSASLAEGRQETGMSCRSTMQSGWESGMQTGVVCFRIAGEKSVFLFEKTI